MEKFECIPALKALSEESRLRILKLLLKRQCSVNEVADKLGMSQYNISKHLRVLREARLLESQKRGKQRLYTLAAGFRAHLAENGNLLDLGCCSFRFNRLPG